MSIKHAAQEICPALRFTDEHRVSNSRYTKADLKRRFVQRYTHIYNTILGIIEATMDTPGTLRIFSPKISYLALAIHINRASGLTILSGLVCVYVKTTPYCSDPSGSLLLSGKHPSGELMQLNRRKFVRGSGQTLSVFPSNRSSQS